jgi:hypothetical protein
MNFGKLLGTGKSFVNGGKPAAYRADKRVYLPKFVSPKNPFASATQVELPQPVAAMPAAAMPVAPAPTKKHVLPSWMQPSPKPEISSQPKPLAAWTTKLNPASLWRGSEPAKATRAVQTELSLEKVKVVHNDLTDADVEVVPMKSRPARPVVPDLPPAKHSWEILGERMLEVRAF